MMPGSFRARLGLGTLAVLAVTAAHAATDTHFNPIISAIQRGDCDKAAKALSAAMEGQDAPYAMFVAGRLLDEGICFKQDREKATNYFEHSAALGEADAQLDYAAKVGLGEGTPQDYASAGFECHKGGVDPSGLYPFYSLGYACTVRAVAGRLLRTSLPQGALRLPTRPAMVEFNPVTSELRIDFAPNAAAGAAMIGSIDGEGLGINIRSAIQKAWHDALAIVPKPEQSSLTGDAVQLSLDIDRTLETRTGSTTFNEPRALMPSDLSNRPMTQTGGMMMH